jgi:hypothetical protein
MGRPEMNSGQATAFLARSVGWGENPRTYGRDRHHFAGDDLDLVLHDNLPQNIPRQNSNLARARLKARDVNHPRWGH